MSAAAAAAAAAAADNDVNADDDAHNFITVFVVGDGNDYVYI